MATAALCTSSTYARAQPSHVLVCTQEFISQTEPLNVKDFAAIAEIMMSLGPCLAFYNFGVHSGRSQPHKHVQVRGVDVLVLRAAHRCNRHTTRRLCVASMRAGEDVCVCVCAHACKEGLSCLVGMASLDGAVRRICAHSGEPVHKVFALIACAVFAWHVYVYVFVVPLTAPA